MNREEQLWNYIDGRCSPAEALEIEARLAADTDYQQLYEELLGVHHMLQHTDLEEPAMSFTRNVMERVKLEPVPVALKTKVDQRIIRGIGAFFVISLLSILFFAFANSSADLKIDLSKFDFSVDLSKYISARSLQVFLFVELAIALVFMDSYLRRKNRSIQKKEA